MTKVFSSLSSIVVIYFILLRFDVPLNPTVRYRYPAPTVNILTNIINTLASAPKFYTQVLHLMNKMSLPAPFGPVTPTPPLVSLLVNINMLQSISVLLLKAVDTIDKCKN